MATRRRRYSVNLGLDLETWIEKLALHEKRSVASQIEFIVEEYRAKQLKELEYFRPSRLHEAKGPEEPQFFQTPPGPAEEKRSTLREKLGRDST